ncbi:MAG: ribosome recycling factor, partial [Deltaproteobacteria bacterium]|nr:ribosome recycling factor [Deltaproteobacteria bacterium]
ERRKELVKVMKKQAEETRVSLRNIRRDANEELKALKKEGGLTEDEERANLERMQKLTDEYIAKIDDAVVHKEKDILAV